MSADFGQKYLSTAKLAQQEEITPEQIAEALLLETPDEDEELAPSLRICGKEILIERRLIPLGRSIEEGRPKFLPFPKLTDEVYNVFSCVSPMGGGKSTILRNLIYWMQQIEESIMIIFDPMHLEFSKLTQKNDTQEKRDNLMSERLHDPVTGEWVQVEIEPDALKVFHLIPRYAIMKRSIDVRGQITWKVDETTYQIMCKDGGKIIAEDMCFLREEQLFSLLNYDEIRTNARIHFYLRRNIGFCNRMHGPGLWFAEEFIESLKDPPREDMSKPYSHAVAELELIEKLEKYKEDGVFVLNERERKEYGYDIREIIRHHKIVNVSYLAFKKTTQHGQNVVKGQTDLILQHLLDISNEFYQAVRLKEQGLPVDEWQQFLLDNWKVSLVFEESEIFLPPVDRDMVKTKPCLRIIEYMMSVGRKYGFKNLLLLTQRLSKMNKILWEETSIMFVGPIHGEQRDSILKSYGVDKVQFKIIDDYGNESLKRIKDVVTTLSKEKHQWVYINKERKQIFAIETYDSPVG